MIYYRHGETTMVDHIYGAGEGAGQAILVGGTDLLVLHSDTDAGQLGAGSAANGNVVYEIDKEADSDTYVIGDAITIDLANHYVPTANTGAAFGTCVKASSATDSTVWVRFTG